MSYKTVRLRRAVVPLLAGVLVFYCGSYLHLSRRGFVRADQMQAEGFWFVEPPGSASAADFWIIEALRIGYSPLLALDHACGTGRAAAAWPMRGLN